MPEKPIMTRQQIGDSIRGLKESMEAMRERFDCMIDTLEVEQQRLEEVEDESA